MKPLEIKSVGWLLMQAARLHRFHLSEQLADRGLYAGQEQLLRALVPAEARSVGELSQILQVRPPTVSKSLNRLVKSGLIERYSESGGPRAVWVRLTPRGHALAESIEASWNKVEDDLMKDFDEKDRRRLRKLLRRASKNLTEALGGDERQFDVPNDALEQSAKPPARGSEDRTPTVTLLYPASR
jgi:DNA-binding MarR family transcriptional regulator